MIYIIDEFILFLMNPFGVLIIMASLLYTEKIIIKNIKGGGQYNHAVRVKIKEIN